METKRTVVKLKNGMYIPIPTEIIPQGTRIFGRNVLDGLKKAKEGFRRKQRLVSKGYID